jgi:hypothetical protein
MCDMSSFEQPFSTSRKAKTKVNSCFSFVKKMVLTYSFIYSTIFSLQAQDYQISLLTCDPGEEVYTTFGHSAIRVKDSIAGTDLVYNYGTFDFGAPFFLFNFTRRTLDYMLSVTTYDRFLFEYNYFQRNVREQVLDLNPEQTANMVQFLEINRLPENKFYRYDFFYDNCATRVRDVLETVLGKQLDWNDVNDPERKTFRNLIDEYVYPLPWADFGIDLALGAVIDVNATEREKQFLPDYMEAAFARAQIVGDGPTRPLVKAQYEVLTFEEQASSLNFFQPLIIWWVLAIVFMGITYLGFKKKRLYKGFDIAYFGILGIVGIVITLLWFFTFHSQTKWNWNILWAFPGHLLLAIAMLKTTWKPWVKKYLLFLLISTNLALVCWVLGFQSFHPSIVPLLLISLLRSNFLYYNQEKFALLR